jgi:hypothetical protein
VLEFVPLKYEVGTYMSDKNFQLSFLLDFYGFNFSVCSS